MALLAASRSGVCLRVVGRLGLSCSRAPAVWARDRLDAAACGGRRAGEWLPGGDIRSADGSACTAGARRFAPSCGAGAAPDGALWRRLSAGCARPLGDWLGLRRVLLCAVRGSGSGRSAHNILGRCREAHRVPDEHLIGRGQFGRTAGAASGQQDHLIDSYTRPDDCGNAHFCRRRA